MLQDPLTLYKLIILYMLNRVTIPLTNAQISDFMLERDYTNFLTLQQAITEEGIQTLYYFDNRIGDSIKKEIDSYFLENELTLRNEVSIQSNYYKSTSGEFEAHLIAKDRNISLVDITLSVPNEEVAVSICDNWQNKNEAIYQYLIRELF